MKKIIVSSMFRAGVAAAIVSAAVLVNTAEAHPYASGITNSSGTISFILNEAATSVSISLTNPGTGHGTTIAGTTAMGLQSFSMTQSATTYSTYSIIVNKTGSGSPSQISLPPGKNAGQTPFADYFGPRGVGVNENPATHNFGRIYICDGAGGSNSLDVRVTGRGMYVVNADLSDAVGHGTNVFPASGITYGSSTTYGPYRAFVGPDDTVYVTDENGSGVGTTTGTATLFSTDPDLITPTPIFKWGLGGTTNFGNLASRPYVTGSLAQGNLDVKCIMYGFPTNGSYITVYDYPINSGPLPWNTAPSCVISNAVGKAISGVNGVIGDMYVGPDGKYFVLAERATAIFGAVGGNSALWVYDSAGNYLFDSATAVGNTNQMTTNGNVFPDPFVTCYAVAVSADDKYVAALNGSTASIILAKLTNGVPDVSTVTVTATGIGATARGLAFDAADNVVVCSGGNQLMKVYSLGLTTTCTTSGDTLNPTPGNNDGTFSITIPPTTVSVVATTNQASQGGFNGSGGTPVAGNFSITRNGGTATPLTVSFTLSGTATNSEYTAKAGASTFTSTNGAGVLVTNSVTIAIGAVSTNITITPINDGVPRLTNTVILSLFSGSNFGVGISSDTVFIQNTAAQQLVITTNGASSMYKAYSNDYASVIVERLGDTTVPNYTVSASSFTAVGGTAVVNMDYTPFAGATVISNGAIFASSGPTISPLVNGAIPTHSLTVPYTGNKTIVVGLNGGTDSGSGISYTSLGTTTTLTLVDNAYPTAPVLYSDALSDPADGANWRVNFANGNLAGVGTNGEWSVYFGYDLASDNDPANGGLGAIPLPPNNSATALRITVNKTTGVAAGSQAGINLYPNGQTFSNNYALRFQMNLIQGFNLPSATEGALFGINCSGSETNWFTGSAIVDTNTIPYWPADGVWFWMSADAGGAASGDYQAFTGNGLVTTNQGWVRLPVSGLFYNNPGFTNAFKGPQPFSGYNTAQSTTSVPVPESGLPANGSSADNLYSNNSLPVPGGYDAAWADVEVKQVNNVVTWSINKTKIMAYTNTSTATSMSTNGNIMLGYEDPFASVGSVDAVVFFSNVQVVQLGGILITSINATTSGATTTVAVTFTTSDGDDTTSSFALQSTASADAPFADVSPAATFTQNPGTGAFTATTTSTGAQQLYRIRHK